MADDVALATGTYTISGYVDGVKIVVQNKNDNTYLRNTFTLAENATVGIWLDISIGVSLDVTIYPMLNAGDTALPWEPYTGGEASPNMNYPQPLNSHGDGGSIVGKVLGGNVLKYSYPIGYTETKNGIKFTILDDGGINVVGTNTGNEVSFNFIKNKDYFLPSGEYTIHSTGVIEGSMEVGVWREDFKKFFPDTSVTFLKDRGFTGVFVEPTAPLVSICVKPNKTVNTTVYVTLNAGKEVLPHEQYTEQPFTALTPNGLPGIPLGTTIPDVIKNSPIHMSGVYWDNATSQYYIGDTIENGQKVQRILKKTFDGSDDEGWGVETNTPVGNRYLTMVNEKVLVSDTRNGVTSMNTSSQIGYAGDTYVLPNLYVIISDGRLFVSLNGTETLEEFKTILSEKPMTVLCVLANPIITDLTKEELDQYNALLMNYPNTTIVNDAGAYMEVEYVADTKEHIKQNYVAKSEHEALKNRVSEIENVIANL